jgi:hypothetical protein
VSRLPYLLVVLMVAVCPAAPPKPIRLAEPSYLPDAAASRVVTGHGGWRGRCRDHDADGGHRDQGDGASGNGCALPNEEMTTRARRRAPAPSSASDSSDAVHSGPRSSRTSRGLRRPAESMPSR